MTPAEDLNKQYRSRFLRKQAAFDRKYQHLFDKITSDFAMLSTDPNIKFAKAFRFPAYINERIKVMTTDFHDQMLGAIEDDVTDFWSMSNQKNDKLVADYLKTIGTIKASQEAAYFMPNTPALKAFLSQPRGTESLSKRVWNLTEQLQAEMEINLGIGIANGDSADVISRRIRQYLKNPDALFRRVRTPEGRLVASEAMKNYHPGRGRYRSAYKNAMRLARTETNMAYHAADLLRWQQMDMVKGYEVKLSASHHIYDICDLCQGTYPKTFIWVGWHPSCYSDDTEVYTTKGWKLFKDVAIGEEVLSLNKETRDLEATKVVKSFSYHHKGEMIHYSNRSLDMLVTPDHKMIYLGKGNGVYFREKPASEYYMGHGSIYRSSEWKGSTQEVIWIGKYKIEFDLFCEFMGYYLADGSVSFTKTGEFNISQRFDNDVKNRAKIKECLDKLPISYWEAKAGFGSRDIEFRRYLEQFGKSKEKYIPEEIKSSSPRQIKLFLNAFISCDGTIRKPNSFIGNRGNKFIATSENREYFTSSTVMAGELGELILKIGKRPSFRVTEGHEAVFNNGTYWTSPSWRISECKGKTATVFNKDVEKYDGIVYDLEIEKNHTLFIRRNGKCSWGSNCLCTALPVLLPQEEFLEYLRGGKKETNRFVSVYPDNFKKYVQDNFERYSKYKNTPYWMADNKKVIAAIVKKQ